MSIRRWLRAATIILAGLVVLALGLLVALPSLDLSTFAASRATASVGRPVRIGALHVVPGRWIGVEARDVAAANPEGASRPEMLTTTRARAEINAWSLLSGPITLRHVQVEGFDLLLERLPDGQKNWRRAGPAPDRAHTPDDSGLPTILDATLHAKVVFRTTGGGRLVTTLDGVQISAADASHPVRVAGPGSYQGVPLALALDFASFDAIRAAPEPVPAQVLLLSGTTRLGFKGTMRDLLALDGVQGELTFDMPTPDAVFRIAGLDPAPAPPLHLVATLDHADPDWHLANTTGTLGDSAIRTGDILLVEGKPDSVSVALDFERLDLDALLAATRKPGAPDDPPIDIIPAAKPDTLLDLKLSAASLVTNGLTLSDPSLDAAIEPGRWTVSALGFGIFGGQVQADGAVLPAADGTSAHADASVHLDGLDVQATRRALGAGAVPLGGRIEGRAVLQTEGATLERAIADASASAVVTLKGGSIAREVIEAASTDARALFRSARGYVPVSCLLGLVTLHGPELSIAPLRIRSSAGTIIGRGRANLVRRTVDLTIASESSTTSAFALDVPLHVSGPFSKPSIVPAELSARGRAQLAEPDAVRRLPSELQADARRSPCLERAR